MTETHVFYAPGDWTLLARSGHYLLLQAAPTDRAVSVLWEALESADTAIGALAALNGELPGVAFCLLSVSADGIQAAQHGIVAALDGHDLQVGATASEVPVPGTGAMLIAATGPGAATQQIPLESGVVAAGALIVVQVGSAPAAPPVEEPVEAYPEEAYPEEAAAPFEDPEDPEEPEQLEPVTTTSTWLWDDVPAFDQAAADGPPVELAAPLPPAAPMTLADAPPPLPGTAASYPADPAGPILAPPPAPLTEPDAPTDGTVLTRICLDGHLSSADESTCQVCGSVLPPQTARAVPQPSLGALVLPDGERFDLDRGAVLGRAPRVPEDAVGTPHLVNLAAYGRDVSRQHVEVLVRGWSVSVRDLGSANGTRVHSPTGEVTVLEPGVEVPLVADSVIDVAEVAQVRYRTDG